MGSVAYTTGDIRNVLIAGHGQAGKTTLVDAMLLAAGAVNRKASPADGNSFADFEKEEKEQFMLRKKKEEIERLESEHANERKRTN